jgi:multidrug efflux pump subunit AcrA (membrane-fusion protein)
MIEVRRAYMKRRIIVAIMAALATILGGLWLSACDSSTKPIEPIFASGFIEAKDVSLAFEVSGRIVLLAAAEGDEVRASAPLVKLDGQQEAQAALELAQAGLGQAVVSRDGAKRVWDDAIDVRNNPLELEARIIAAQGELELVEIILERAGRQDPTYGKWEERTAEIRRDIAEKALQNLLAIRDNP